MRESPSRGSSSSDPGSDSGRLLAGWRRLKGAWIVRKLGPLGTLKIGQFRAPLSLEGRTGSKYTSFMERGLPNALVPDRQDGLRILECACEASPHVDVAVQRRTDDSGQASAATPTTTWGRLTVLPVYGVKAPVSYIWVHPTSISSVRVRRPCATEQAESSLAQQLVTTTRLDTVDSNSSGSSLPSSRGRPLSNRVHRFDRRSTRWRFLCVGRLWIRERVFDWRASPSTSGPAHPIGSVPTARSIRTRAIGVPGNSSLGSLF